MADDLIPHQIITLVSLAGGLICIYASNISSIGGIFSIIATILGVVYGTNTLRHVGKYSLGTGVPSIVYMLTACGLISSIVGISLSLFVDQSMLFPIISVVIAGLIGLSISLICKYVFNIQVEILSKSFMSIAIATTITIMAMSTLVLSSSDANMIYHYVIEDGLIILFMIITVMAIQNPYNSCMGPNEDQYRTLSLAIANAFLMLMVISIISVVSNGYWYVYLVISLIGWIISIRKYFQYTKQQAASVRWYGLWPKNDEEEF